jgi:hypothetical protein
VLRHFLQLTSRCQGLQDETGNKERGANGKEKGKNERKKELTNGMETKKTRNNNLREFNDAFTR